MAQQYKIDPEAVQVDTSFAARQPGPSVGYTVVSETPNQSHAQHFPLSFSRSYICIVSILTLIVGSFLFIFAGLMFHLVFQRALEQFRYLPIWYSIFVLANGAVGCVLSRKQTKCLFGAFLALSIITFILSISNLILQSVVASNLSIDPGRCLYFVSSQTCDGSSLTNVFVYALVPLTCLEIICSIQLVVLSCRPYSKCCAECDVVFCCICVACCECDTAQLYLPENMTTILLPMQPSSSVPGNEAPVQEANMQG